MALYPSPPDLRLAFDRDGSVGFWVDETGVVHTLSTANLQAWNNESADDYSPSLGGSNVTWYLGVVFPAPRDLTAYYLADSFQVSGGVPQDFQTSVNTTSGSDGAWVGHGVTNDASGTISPNYRSSIVSLSVTGITGIRVPVRSGASGVSYQFRALHLYGKPSVVGSAPASSDQVIPWHPTLNQIADGTTGDDGDMPRSSSLTKTFRFKNNSTRTAKTVNVSLETLTDASPSLFPQYQLSLDNITFSATVSLGDLAPGAISQVIYCRDTVSSSAQLSVWACRAVPSPASFV